MRIFLKWYWLLTGFAKKYALSVFLGLLAGIIAFVFGPRFIKYLPIKSTQHIGRVGAYTLSQLPLDIQQKISKGLTQNQKNGQPILDIASNLSISEDGTTYRFTLKPDIYWSNGQKLKSSDITLNLKEVTVEYPTDDVISLKLQQPFAPFLTILSQPLLKRITTGFPIKKTQVIGLNEYNLTNMRTQGQYITRLNLSSKEDHLIYHFFPTEEEALTAYKLGTIDIIENLSSPYLEDWSNTQSIENQFTHRFLTLFFNTSNPVLQDKTLRQALTYAIPKKTDQGRVISPIDKESWAYNPQVKPYEYNLETSKTMLDKLKKENPNLDFTFTLTTTPAYTDMANRIIENWQQLGIVTQLVITPVPDTSDYQILLIGQQIPEDPDQYLLWHSTQSTNITKYKSPKIDKLLEDGRKELNTDKRKQIYLDFQRFLLEDCPAAFLHRLSTYNLSRK